MDLDDLPAPGSVITHERTFTTDEVAAFAELSGDRGEHHERPDEEGRLLVHGLLTATLPTKIGGDLDVLARTMEFDFHRPVYTGQRIVCEVTVEAVDRDGDRATVEADIACHRDGDEVVLTGAFEGVVLG
ncbi:dehydratase [Halobaculum sp. CBA1158]|uniref:hotdog domain-containing protein n=1 Tax=Halobaculum sp. CBA1158 TaxID=2904243 RepID=UPI001F477A81|nr:hotdog domain-containing protein [Halobaculum sp. CBA1158]UIO98550.1 dehydratase [Halobaculum sp. CBA1158]